MPDYYEIRVALKGIRPPIWRRFLIRSTASFTDLHNAIQDAMGWNHSHLWMFREPGRGGGPIAGVPMDDDWEEIPDADRTYIASYLGVAAKCEYLYDFGDGWEHLITCQKQVSYTEAFHRRLLAGKRSCPPEDCGGIPGYYRMLEFTETGQDPYGDDNLDEWLCGWTPESFDPKVAKRSFDR